MPDVIHPDGKLSMRDASSAATCANCGKVIGALEAGRVFQGKPVCAACESVLEPVGTQYRPVVTERTGKRIKVHVVLAGLMMVAGMVVVGVHVPRHVARMDFSWVVLGVGGGLVVVGLGYLVMARLAAWWYHG